MIEAYTKNINNFNITIHLEGQYLTKLEFTTIKPSTNYSAFARDIFNQLEKYFSKKLTKFTIACKIEYNYKYQFEFYRELEKIKHGEVIHYQGLAAKIGDKNLSRWIGKLCSINPIPIIYPCHRITAKNHLGGFNGGIEIKKKLLELENIKLL